MTVALVLASVALAVALTTAAAVVVLARQNADAVSTLRQHLLGHDAAHTAAHSTPDPQPAERPHARPVPNPTDDTGPITVTRTDEDHAAARADQLRTAAMRAPGRHAEPHAPPRPRPEERRP